MMAKGCIVSTASEVFLIFTTQLYQYLSMIFLFSLVSDEPEVFLPKYSQTTILHASSNYKMGRTILLTDIKHNMIY